MIRKINVVILRKLKFWSTTEQKQLTLYSTRGGVFGGVGQTALVTLSTILAESHEDTSTNEVSIMAVLYSV